LDFNEKPSALHGGIGPALGFNGASKAWKLNAARAELKQEKMDTWKSIRAGNYDWQKRMRSSEYV
jgi:hypothetical protein